MPIVIARSNNLNCLILHSQERFLATLAMTINQRFLMVSMRSK